MSCSYSLLHKSPCTAVGTHHSPGVAVALVDHFDWRSSDILRFTLLHLASFFSPAKQLLDTGSGWTSGDRHSTLGNQGIGFWMSTRLTSELNLILSFKQSYRANDCFMISQNHFNIKTQPQHIWWKYPDWAVHDGCWHSVKLHFNHSQGKKFSLKSIMLCFHIELVITALAFVIVSAQTELLILNFEQLSITPSNAFYTSIPGKSD